MRKWPLVSAFFAAAIIGCGGGGGSNGGITTSSGSTGLTSGTTSGSTSGTTGRSTSSVKIPNRPGLLDFYFLPGQGRSVPYYTAVINHVDVTDTQLYNTVTENAVPGDIDLQLNGYNAQNRRVNAAVPAPGSANADTSRLFTELSISFKQFLVDTGSGQQTYNGYVEDLKNSINISSFQGRNSAVQIFLNDGMFDFASGSAALDTTQFFAQNNSPISGKINGFLSDYLRFDISHLANKPTLVNTPGQAQAVYISGDNYALSQSAPATGKTAGFEVLTPFGSYPGFYRSADPTTGVKSYQLTQPDPTSFQFPPRQITALAGVYYSFTERINVADSTLMIAFPQTGDGPKQELAIVTSSGGVVSGLYFGTINYAAAGGPSFTAYPIQDIQPASTAGMISGKLSTFTDANGTALGTSGANWWQLVHGGQYTVTNGSGVPTSGKLLVYRL